MVRMGGERYAGTPYFARMRSARMSPIEGVLMPLMQRFMKFVSGSGIFSDARLLEMYPPFVPMRIRVLEIADGLAQRAHPAAVECACRAILEA